MENRGKMKKINLSNRMRNVVKISSGNIIAQLISIVTLPIITRMYGAEVIGAWTTINAIATILIYLCDLGLSQAIMVEREENVIDLYCVVTTISTAICVFSFTVIILYYSVVLKQDTRTACINSIFAVVYTFTFRQVQTCYVWLNRKKDYNTLMKNPIINYSAIAIFSIIMYILGFKTYGYYVGTTLGQVLTLLHMKRRLPKEMFCFSSERIKSTITENDEFVKFQMPAQIAAQARQQLPNLLIGSLFGNKVLGYFSISQKLISIPVNFIGQALGKVFYQTLAELQRQGDNISYFVKRNMSRAMKVAFVPMVLFAAFGDAAIVMFFGAEYSIGGTISRIMVFRACFTFISTSLTGIDIVLRKQKYSMITCVTQTVLASLGVIVSYYLTNNIYVCTFFIAISFIIVQMLYFGKMYSVMHLKPLNYYMGISVLLVSVLLCSYGLRYAFVWITNVTGLPLFTWLKSFMVM